MQDREGLLIKFIESPLEKLKECSTERGLGRTTKRAFNENQSLKAHFEKLIRCSTERGLGGTAKWG